MSSLDLITLNNFLVSLRHPITQSKVHVIHKLTRRITQLRRKKGSEEQKQQNERKAARMVEEIKVLKDMPKDQMCRFAFRNRQKLDKVLAGDDMKLRALVRVSCHPSVEKPVLELRGKYPNWKKEEQSLLAKMGRIQDKKSPGIKMAKKLKQKTKQLDKKLKEEGGLKRDPKGEDLDIRFLASVKSSKSDQGSESDHESKEEEDIGSDKDFSEEEDEETSEESEEEDEEEEVVSAPPSKIFKRSGTMEVKTLNLEGGDEIEQSENESKDDSESVDDDKRIDNEAIEPSKSNGKLLKDSFFLGGGDSDIQSDTDELKDDFEEKARPHKSYGKREGFHQKLERGSDRRFGRRGGGHFSGNFREKHDRNREAPEKLHPSWAAKRRNQNSNIHGFEGKRTTFDNVANAERGNNSKKTSDSTKLHPSWAAKRKATQIQGFQGKKIKFD